MCIWINAIAMPIYSILFPHSNGTFMLQLNPFLFSTLQITIWSLVKYLISSPTKSYLGRLIQASLSVSSLLYIGKTGRRAISEGWSYAVMCQAVHFSWSNRNVWVRFGIKNPNKVCWGKNEIPKWKLLLKIEILTFKFVGMLAVWSIFFFASPAVDSKGRKPFCENFAPIFPILILEFGNTS